MQAVTCTVDDLRPKVTCTFLLAMTRIVDGLRLEVTCTLSC